MTGYEFTYFFLSKLDTKCFFFVVFLKCLSKKERVAI